MAEIEPNSADSTSEVLDVLIVGAGFSGVYLLHRLRDLWIGLDGPGLSSERITDYVGRLDPGQTGPRHPASL